MKELSLEEKAKRYDEAIGRANDILKGYNPKEGSKATINYIFPELHESKDERIRKEILEYFQQFENEELRGVDISDWIAWLEKQGVHANFRRKIQIGDKVTRNKDGILVNISQLNRVAKKDKKQEQKPAWSEEDEWKFSDILALLRGGENCHYNTPDLFDWFKSLKNRIKGE